MHTPVKYSYRALVHNTIGDIILTGDIILMGDITTVRSAIISNIISTSIPHFADMLCRPTDIGELDDDYNMNDHYIKQNMIIHISVT